MSASKKFLCLLMSVIMLLSLCAPCFAAGAETPEYDKDKVSANNAEYIASLSDEQTAAILLDWLDSKIAEHADDFAALNKSLSPVVSLEVNCFEDLLAYADYKSVLGGDFAKLDTSALSGLKRSDGDISFISGLLQFLSDNAETLSKVFYTDEAKRFDYGAVGTYILSLDKDDEIRVFYDACLCGIDLSDEFKTELAETLGYTVQDGDTADDVLNNGVLQIVTEFLSENGLLSDAGVNRVNSELDLKTTDTYALVKALVGIVQDDNAAVWSTRYTYYLENLIRPVLKTTVGYTMVEGASAQLPDNPYADMAELRRLAGDKRVLMLGTDGKYYSFVVNDNLQATDVKSITWECEIAFAPGELTVYTGPVGSETAVKTYSTMNDDAVPVIYTDYAEQLKGTEYEEYITSDSVPEATTALMVDANKTAALADYIRFETVQDGKTLLDESVSFAAIETYAEEQADALALSMMKQTFDSMGVTYGDDLGVDVDVTLSYNGWATDDAFIVTCDAAAEPTFSGSITYMGITMDVNAAFNLLPSAKTLVQDEIAKVLANPVATVVVDKIALTENEQAALDLAGMLNTDFDIDYSILDFYGNYDSRNGVIGQFNDIVCKMTAMFTTDEGYEKLDLKTGLNDNLTTNLEKICAAGEALTGLAKEYVELNDFKSLTDGLNVNQYFASDHGFNAAMVYNLDFSEVENLYVCGIRLISDFAVPDTSDSVFHEIHEAVEFQETLDEMTASVSHIILNRLNNDLTSRFGEDGYDYVLPAVDIAVTEANCKDVVMNELTGFVLYASNFAVDTLVNDAANALIESYFAKLGEAVPEDCVVNLKFGVKAQNTWEATLDAIVNRAYKLLDGVVIPMDGYEGDTMDKLSNMLCSLLPMGSLLSNCASDEFVCDIDYLINDVIFTEVVSGDMDNFLRLFETKTKTGDVLEGVSATMAVITASEYILDNIFPDTINREDYTASETVLDYFASSEGIALIAKNLFASLNGQKDTFVPAALRLIRESGLLPFFCSGISCTHEWEQVDAQAATCCEKGHSAYKRCKLCGELEGYEEYAVNPDAHKAIAVPAVAKTCTANGCTAGTKCAYCGEILSGCEVIPAGHNPVTVAGTAATCTQTGLTEGTVCADCGEVIVAQQVIAKTAHTDSDGDNECDQCGKEIDSSFGARIRAFFNSIGQWFKNLFK